MQDGRGRAAEPKVRMVVRRDRPDALAVRADQGDAALAARPSGRRPAPRRPATSSKPELSTTALATPRRPQARIASGTSLSPAPSPARHRSPCGRSSTRSQTAHAVDLVVLRIDEVDGAGEAVPAQVPEGNAVQLVPVRRHADQRDRARPKQPIEVARAGRLPAPTGRRGTFRSRLPVRRCVDTGARRSRATSRSTSSVVLAQHRRMAADVVLGAAEPEGRAGDVDVPIAGCSTAWIMSLASSCGSLQRLVRSG